MTARLPRRRISVEELADLIDRSPIRRRILEAITAGMEDGASPVGLTRALAAGPVRAPSLGSVAYHVRILERAGALELVAERRIRGAIEHFYRVTELGAAGVQASPLEVAVAALELILERYEDGHLESIPSVAGEALEALGRRRSSVAA